MFFDSSIDDHSGLDDISIDMESGTDSNSTTESCYNSSTESVVSEGDEGDEEDEEDGPIPNMDEITDILDKMQIATNDGDNSEDYSVIAKVFNYFRNEYESLRGPLLRAKASKDLSRIISRTAIATGVPKEDVELTLRNENILNAAHHTYNNEASSLNNMQPTSSGASTSHNGLVNNNYLNNMQPTSSGASTSYNGLIISEHFSDDDSSSDVEVELPFKIKTKKRVVCAAQTSGEEQLDLNNMQPTSSGASTSHNDLVNNNDLNNMQPTSSGASTSYNDLVNNNESEEQSSSSRKRQMDIDQDDEMSDDEATLPAKRKPTYTASSHEEEQLEWFRNYCVPDSVPETEEESEQKMLDTLTEYYAESDRLERLYQPPSPLHWDLSQIEVSFQYVHETAWERQRRDAVLERYENDDNLLEPDEATRAMVAMLKNQSTVYTQQKP